jgi:hypothetical protein
MHQPAGSADTQRHAPMSAAAPWSTVASRGSAEVQLRSACSQLSGCSCDAAMVCWVSQRCEWGARAWRGGAAAGFVLWCRGHARAASAGLDADGAACCGDVCVLDDMASCDFDAGEQQSSIGAAQLVDGVRAVASFLLGLVPESRFVAAFSLSLKKTTNTPPQHRLRFSELHTWPSAARLVWSKAGGAIDAAWHAPAATASASTRRPSPPVWSAPHQQQQAAAQQQQHDSRHVVARPPFCGRALAPAGRRTAAPGSD